MSALAARRLASALSMSGRAVSREAGGVRLTSGIFNEEKSVFGAGIFCGACPSKMARAFRFVLRCSVSDVNAARILLTATLCCDTSSPEMLPSRNRASVMRSTSSAFLKLFWAMRMRSLRLRTCV